MNTFNLDRFISLLALAFATFLPVVPEDLKFWTYTLVALFIIFIIGYGFWDWFQLRNLLDGQIIFDCKEARLPKTSLTPTINTLNLQFSPQSGLTPLGISYRTIPESGDLKWDCVKNNTCYIAKIKNFSSENALDIELNIDATFNENVSHENGNGSGAIIGTHKFKIPIGALIANAEDSYELYIYNLSPYWVNFYPDKHAIIKKLGSKKNKRICVAVDNGLPVKFAFSLPPANL